MSGAEHAGRVTVDIDGYAPNFGLTAIRAYYNLAALADAVDVHVSSSGEGIHLVGWFSEEIPLADRFQLRRALCDDPNRIKIDVERAINGVYTGVLWSEKDRHQGADEAPEDRPGKDRDFADIHDALTHIAMTTSDPHDQMKRLAEHGHRAEPDLARRVGQ